MDDLKVGSRLKELRRQKRLSLRALARETGVAPSFLSALERDHSSVTVGTLKRILDALGTHLGEFFSQGAQPPSKVVYRKGELVEISGQQNGLSYKEVAAGRRGRTLQLIVGHYEPAADTGSDLYHHEGEEAGLVVKGHIELTVDGEVYRLGPGDAYYFDSRRPHRLRNIGSRPALIISANTPASF
jgi:transcriptional regulator with XRE-family HTH domain